MADVFALPSHSEGSPNVLLEAMAANVPIVATTVGGVPEIVQHNESALLVPSNDPPHLTSAIANLLTDKDLSRRLVRQAAELVTTQYTPDNYVRNLIEFYRKAIDSHTSHQL
jgi:glycosyltransferase involved in cell wall biosynthesis